MNFIGISSRRKSLIDYFSACKHITKKGITFITGETEEKFVTYQEVYRRAVNFLYELQAKKVKKGMELVFQIEDPEQYIYIFWACILGGIIAVPVSVGKNDEHRLKLIKIWGKLNSPFLITDQATIGALEKFSYEKGYHEIFAQIKSRTVFLGEVNKGTKSGNINNALLNDIAFIQFSSGSTGDPKGVILTHDNLITNVLAIINCSGINANDSTLNWMPLTHDMGFIGFHLLPIIAGLKQYIMPTSLFIRHPILWMKKAHEHKATVLSSPNFGYKHFLSFFKPEIAKDWDLSHIQIIFNGAEPISTALCHTFLNEMARFGLKKTAMFTVYGLAEASVAVSIPPPGEEFVSLNISREFISIGQTIKEIKGNETNKAISFADVGYPVDNCSVKIYDEDNREVDENVIGFIKIKGRNVTSGYYNDKEATEAAFNTDGWLNTGDLGFLRNGRLVITGRAKDIIFVNGQNYYPHDLERIAEEVEGIELGKVAACGVFNDESQKDEIIFFVIHKTNLPAFVTLSNNLKKFLNKQVGLEITEVIPVKKFPKTTSGKVQRYRLGEMYKNGEFQSVLKELHDLTNTGLTNTEIDRPGNQVEMRLVAVCQEALDNKNIGINDNLFECGANSLSFVRIAAKINEEFNIDIGFNDYFEQNTVAKLASFIMSHQDFTEKRINPPKLPAIEIQPVQEYYPVSSAQKRIYILQKMDELSTAYNIPFIVTIQGKLDKTKFEEAIRKIFARHESFRTSFDFVNGELAQKIEKDIQPVISYIKTTEDQAKSLMAKFVRPFSLDKAPLIRMELAQVSDEKFLLFVDAYHIIADGTSLNVFLRDLACLLNGKDLPELKIQYKDYAVWHNNLLNTPLLKKQEEYWINKFQGEIPILNLPTDFPRPSTQSFEGDQMEFQIDKELVGKLKQLALMTNGTLYMALLAAFNVLLSKYSAQEDIIVGSPIAGRPHTDLENIIGMFVNTIAIRNFPEGKISFRCFLEKVRDNAADAFANSDYPFEILVDKLNLKRDPSRHPLFDVMFALQNLEDPKIAFGDLIITHNLYTDKVSRFDLCVHAKEEGEVIRFGIEYCSKLFTKETIGRLMRHFINILKITTENPEITIREIEILTTEEKNQILFEFNNTKTDYPRDKTIHQLFEEQAEKTPDNIAVIFSERQLTYKELNEKANSLARVLREKGLEKENIVGVIAERSIEMIIGIISVLKAGGTYLPIDPAYPRARIKIILEDSKARIILTQKKFLKKIDFKGKTININDEKIYLKDVSNLKNINTSIDLAYIIYTSGSTGNPKGVMVEHKSVIRLVKNINYINFSENDRILQTGSIMFDAITFEIWGSLLNGLRLYLIDDKSIRDVKYLHRVLVKNQITILWLTSPLFNQLAPKKPEMFAGLKYLLVGGDALSPYHINLVRKFNPCLNIINGYGPTENTTFSTWFLIDKEYEVNIPIGKPISNSTAYIVDKNNILNPVGVPGELWVGGDGLARGYLNHPELTAEKFINNPFIPGERLYRTGDLARWLPDGNIQFLGRIDTQVKIRGYRIELKEVENYILKYKKIKETVVIARRDSEDNKYLCAYFVSNSKVEIKGLRTFLARFLPDYMIPVFFSQLNKIPLTPNGKIDLKALPEPKPSLKAGYILGKPTNGIEEKLVKIWREILPINIIGTKDNFFELGGNSLSVLKLIFRINDYFQVEIPYIEVYMHPTIKELAKIISNTKNNKRGNLNNSLVTLLNQKTEKNVFAFPPIFGSGIVYNNLANILPEYSLYSFDYITDADRIQKYVDEIIRIQENGPYILIGFSAGGKLALAVTRELSRRGRLVSGIILLDTVLLDKRSSPSEDFNECAVSEESDSKSRKNGQVEWLKSRQIFRNRMRYYSSIICTLKGRYIMYIFKEKILNYLEFWFSKNFGAEKVDANIYLIEVSKFNARYTNRLKALTSKSFVKYTGYGWHSGMISQDYVEKNGEIIKEILSKINK